MREERTERKSNRSRTRGAELTRRRANKERELKKEHKTGSGQQQQRTGRSLKGRKHNGEQKQETKREVINKKTTRQESKATQRGRQKKETRGRDTKK